MLRKEQPLDGGSEAVHPMWLGPAGWLPSAQMLSLMQALLPPVLPAACPPTGPKELSPAAPAARQPCWLLLLKKHRAVCSKHGTVAMGIMMLDQALYCSSCWHTGSPRGPYMAKLSLQISIQRSSAQGRTQLSCQGRAVGEVPDADGHAFCSLAAALLRAQHRVSCSGQAVPCQQGYRTRGDTTSSWDRQNIGQDLTASAPAPAPQRGT